MSFAGSGFEVSSRGGNFLGDNADRTFVKIERYQGRVNASFSSKIRCSRSDGRCTGTRFNGSNPSRKFVKMDRYHGRTNWSPNNSSASIGSDVRMRGVPVLLTSNSAMPENRDFQSGISSVSSGRSRFNLSSFAGCGGLVIFCGREERKCIVHAAFAGSGTLSGEK